MSTELEIDLADLNTYLRTLTGSESGADCCWQSFADCKSNPLATSQYAVKTHDSADFKRKIKGLQSNGHGIFVAVNAADAEAVGKQIEVAGRKTSNARGITRGRAWVVEADDGEITKELHREPSIRVESRNGSHLYWLAAEGTTLDEIEAGNKTLVRYYRADPACADIARVLRVPGCYHLKDPKDPYQVRLVEADATRVYSADDLPAAAPTAEEWDDYVSWNRYRKAVNEYGGDPVVDIEAPEWTDIRDKAAAYTSAIAAVKAKTDGTTKEEKVNRKVYKAITEKYGAWDSNKSPDDWQSLAEYSAVARAVALHQPGDFKLADHKVWTPEWDEIRPAAALWIKDVEKATKGKKTIPSFDVVAYKARAKAVKAVKGDKGGAASSGAQSGDYRGDWMTFDIVGCFKSQGKLKSELEPGKWAVTCPFTEHPESGSTTVIWAGGEDRPPAIHCSRGRCEGKGLKDLVEAFGADVLMEHTREVRVFATASEVELADDLVRQLGGRDAAVYDRDQVWVVGEDALWHPKQTETMSVMVMDFDGRQVMGANGTRPLIMSEAKVRGVRKLTEARLADGRAGWFDHRAPGLATSTGMVAVDGTVTAYTAPARVRVTDVISAPWLPDSDCPRWHRFLREVLGTDDQIGLCQEFFGAALWCLAPRFEKAMVMLGEGANGKSTLLSVLEACFQKASVTSVPPAMWGQEYHRAHMASAQLNCVRDMPSRELVDAGEIKQIISGEPTTARQIYGKPFEYRPRAAHVFAANQLPAVADRSDGFWRRFLVLAFDRQFSPDQADVGLSAKLKAELPGIVAWARIGAERLVRNGRYTSTKRGEELAAEWRLDCDPVARWVGECVEADDTAQTTGTEMYTAYREWSQSQGHHPVSATKLGKELKRLKLGHGRTKAGMYYKARVVTEKQRISQAIDDAINGEVFADVSDL